MELDVPLYLHPRDTAPDQQRAYRGYEGLLGSAWGFGAETALHTLRLLCSGLFDELPQVKLILGHLGEGLPFGLPRVQHRLDNQKPCGRHKMPLTCYFEKNVYTYTRSMSGRQGRRKAMVFSLPGTSPLKPEPFRS